MTSRALLLMTTALTLAFGSLAEARTVIGNPLSGGPTSVYVVGDECHCPGVCGGVNTQKGTYEQFYCVSTDPSASPSKEDDSTGELWLSKWR